MEIIPLGLDCCLAYQLNKLNLRKKAYPFDWMSSPKILSIILLLENDFKNFLNIEYYDIQENNNDNFNINNPLNDLHIIKSKYKLIHKEYNFVLRHELINNDSKNINIFIEKYSRRIQRFLSLQNNKNIFIRLGTNKDIIYLERLELILKQKFKFSQFKFINCSNLDKIYKPLEWKRDEYNWNDIL
jgi:hypothetical protein